MKPTDTYNPPIKIHFPNMVANVYIPILSNEERTRRLKELHNQAAQLLKGVKRNDGLRKRRYRTCGHDG